MFSIDRPYVIRLEKRIQPDKMILNLKMLDDYLELNKKLADDEIHKQFMEKRFWGARFDWVFNSNWMTTQYGMNEDLATLDYTLSINDDEDAGYELYEYDISSRKYFTTKKRTFSNILSTKMSTIDNKSARGCEAEDINFKYFLSRFRTCIKHLNYGGQLLTTLLLPCKEKTIQCVLLGLLLFERMNIITSVKNQIYVHYENFKPLIKEIPKDENFEVIAPEIKVEELREFFINIFKTKLKLTKILVEHKHDEFMNYIYDRIIEKYEFVKDPIRLAEIYKLVLTTFKVLKKDKDGRAIKVHSNIRYDEGKFLETTIRKLKYKNILEVGMAFGISAMFMTSALPSDGKLTSIDPFQMTQWSGYGVNLIKQIGLESKHELIEKKSYEALPELLKKKEKYDMIFIDGWHTFDYTLVDFFYSDLLLKVKGIIIIDDALHSGVAKCVRYIQSNYHHYRKIETGTETFAAFIKMSEDKRDWNFHKPF